MAFELVQEVLDHAPAMTAAERLILVCIAEKSRLPGRSAQIPAEELARRTNGMGERGIRQALTRLADKGLEVRLPLGFDRHGAPYFAVPGKIRHFHVPHFLPAPGDCKCYGCTAIDLQPFPSSAVAEPQFPLAKLERVMEEPQRRQAEPQFLHRGNHSSSIGGTTVPPIPSVEDSIPSLPPAALDVENSSDRQTAIAHIREITNRAADAHRRTSPNPIRKVGNQ